jgi:CheY-like chemotaxis protein/anti-sigma regulatory factor (Ser/Thr protein kinase)
LPHASSKKRPEKPHAKPPTKKRPPHILVAGDDPVAREMVADSLRAENYAVTTASDGKEALALLDKSKFDLAVLDVWMPSLSGLDVLKALHRKKSPPKVIAITANGAASTILTAIRERVCRCIAKPVDPRDLISLVEEALARKSPPPRIDVVSARPEWVEVLIPCTLEAAGLIESFMISLESDLSLEIRGAVGQAFHELLLNAVEWGGHFDAHRRVRISRLRTRRMLLYRIADPGKGFQFSKLAHAAIGHHEPTEHQDARRRKGLRPGGFGLVLAKATADELLYNETQNEVVFVKYLDNPATPATK